MLRMRDLLYREYAKPLSAKRRATVTKRLLVPAREREFVEFLYLNGPEKGWNWGKNGATNASFLQDQARDYFRRFF